MKNLKKCELTIDGMHCDSCELFMEETIRKQQGVVKVSADSKKQKVEITLGMNINQTELERKISDQIEKHGYRIVNVSEATQRSKKTVALSFLLAVSLMSIFVLLQNLQIATFFNPERITLPAIFLLGIVASLSTCMAVVGGVALTLSSKLAVEQKTTAIWSFHLARIIGFIVLGGVIGLLGRIIHINAVGSAILKVAIAVVMLPIAADLVGIRLPKLVLPKSLSKMFGVFDDKAGTTQAVIVGVTTFFLPCAFTQSMQFYAVSTASFVQGALVMGAFALGTLPVLLLITLGAANNVTRFGKGLFAYTSGFLILLFALLNILSGIAVLLGIPFPLSI